MRYRYLIPMLGIGMLFTLGAPTWPQVGNAPSDTTLTRISRSQLLSGILSPTTTPTQHWILIQRAKESGLLEDAVTHYNKLRLKHPDKPELQSAFGCAFYTARERPHYRPAQEALWRKQGVELQNEADEAIRSAVAGNGNENWFCWFVQGYVWARAWGNFVEARECLNKAAELNPGSSFVHAWLALSYLAQDKGFDPVRGLKEAQKAISLNKSLYLSYKMESAAYKALSNYKAALNSYEKCLSLLPPEYKISNGAKQELNNLKRLVVRIQ